MSKETDAKKLETLANEWKIAKKGEQEFNEKRKQIEKDIVALSVVSIKKGTTHLNVDNLKTGIKVVQGETVKVDLSQVRELKKEFPKELMIFWPFEVKELKVEKTKLEQLQTVNAELYKKSLATITTVLGSPSFSFKDKEGE